MEENSNDHQAGNRSGSINQLQWQANAGQSGHAPDAESLRPHPDPLAQLRQTPVF